MVLILKNIDSNKEIEFDSIPPNWLISASPEFVRFGTILDNQSIKVYLTSWSENAKSSP